MQARRYRPRSGSSCHILEKTVSGNTALDGLSRYVIQAKTKKDKMGLSPCNRLQFPITPFCIIQVPSLNTLDISATRLITYTRSVLGVKVCATLINLVSGIPGLPWQNKMQYLHCFIKVERTSIAQGTDCNSDSFFWNLEGESHAKEAIP